MGAGILLALQIISELAPLVQKAIADGTDITPDTLASTLEGYQASAARLNLDIISAQADGK